MKIIIVSAAILLLQSLCTRANDRFEREQAIMKAILDPSVYDASIRPFDNGTDRPVAVTVNMYIRSIDNLDDVNMEYSLQVTFRQSWKDPRLSYMDSYVRYLTVTNPHRIWRPDTFFSNEKEGHFHNIMEPNILMRIYPDGQILFSTRISLKLSCPMDFRYFPVDSQTCSIIGASYGYTTEDLVYIWKEDAPVQISKNIHQQFFVLENSYVDYCTSRTNTGQYSCIKVDLQFRRQFQYYFMEIYMPSIILVAISWICFWLDRKATTARVLIWMAVLLAFLIKLVSLRDEVPRTNYITPYDTWMTTCFLFFVTVILEIGTVAFLYAREERKNVAENASGINNYIKERASEDLVKQDSNVIVRKYHIFMKTYPTSGQRIDIFCRILFPLAFSLFNLFYWTCTAIRRD